MGQISIRAKAGVTERDLGRSRLAVDPQRLLDPLHEGELQVLAHGLARHGGPDGRGWSVR